MKIIELLEMIITARPAMRCNEVVMLQTEGDTDYRLGRIDFVRSRWFNNRLSVVDDSTGEEVTALMMKDHDTDKYVPIDLTRVTGDLFLKKIRFFCQTE